MKIDQVTYQPPFVQTQRVTTGAGVKKADSATERARFSIRESGTPAAADAKASPQPGKPPEIASPRMAAYLSDEEKRFLSALFQKGGGDFGTAAYVRGEMPPADLGQHVDLKG